MKLCYINKTDIQIAHFNKLQHIQIWKSELNFQFSLEKKVL